MSQDRSRQRHGTAIFEPTAVDVLRLYMKEVGRYPVLSREEELRVAREAQAGDTEALKTLIQANLRFVISLAKNYQDQGVSLHDLIQEGNIGLMRAAETFDPDRGFRFITHARHWVRARMTQAIAKSARTVRLPVSQLRKMNAVRSAAIELARQLGRTPTTAELARHVGMSLPAVERLLHLDQPIVSLDAPPTNSEGDLHALISHGSDDPAQTIQDRERQRLLYQALSGLDERRQRVLELYFGLAGEESLTLEQISAIMGVTRERIRQLRDDGLKRLRRRLQHAAPGLGRV